MTISKPWAIAWLGFCLALVLATTKGLNSRSIVDTCQTSLDDSDPTIKLNTLLVRYGRRGRFEEEGLDEDVEHGGKIDGIEDVNPGHA